MYKKVLSFLSVTALVFGVFASSAMAHFSPGEAPHVEVVSKLDIENADINPALGEKSTIGFTLKKDGFVSLDIYRKDRRIKRLANKYLDAGHHHFEWNGKNSYKQVWNDGAYIVKLVYREKNDTKPLEQIFGAIDINAPHSIALEEFGVSKASIMPLPYFMDELEVYFRLSDANEDGVVVLILDKDGYIVKRHFSRDLEDRFVWDGTGAGGYIVPAGQYEVKIVVEKELEEAIVDSLWVEVKEQQIVDIEQEEEDALTWAKRKGIVESGKKFDGNRIVSRVEALKMVLVALEMDYEESDAGNAGFLDVESGQWYVKYIKSARDIGIFSGDRGTPYARPDFPVNRVEASKLIFESLNRRRGFVAFCKDNKAATMDIDLNEWYAPYACSAANLGIFHKYNGEYFAPEAAVTREEMVNAMFKLKESIDNL